uniref:zinc finger BED domain-containing protein 1 n=1 Tax=Urocitellus parryii TaxID=9999 RepID=UPI000E55A7E9|nr:zinc finger BED domain-containing protein 1 [Urocitellus parryii]
MESKAGDPSQADLKLVAHPRAKSKVWKYFGFDTNAEGCILQWKKIYCRICMSQIAYSGNTSNLSYHLEKNHPEEFCEFIKSNTEQMREAFATAFSKLKPDASSSSSSSSAASSSSPSTTSQPPPPPPPSASSQLPGAQDALAGKPGLEGRRQQELTGAVLALLCEGLFPASTVDEPAFRALLRAAEPRYELPSARFFGSRALPARYGAVREAVRKELAEAAWCGVSTELWRSDNQNRAYVTLAAHFLGLASPNCLSVASRCLKTFEVPEENAAETITRVLYETFIEWGVSAKVSGATTDGGKDVAQACSLLDIPVHMPCLGRAFDAAIQQAFRLPKLAALLARCRRLVAYFQQSSVARYMLAEKQRLQGAARCMLVSNRVAGWGSTLAMLQRLREQQFAIAGVLVEDSNNHHLMLEAAEWATIDGLVELLQPFKQVAEVLAAARHPTISMVKPLLHMLLNTTLHAKDGDPKDLSMAKEVMAKELTRTYQEAPETDLFLNVATFLDPRYKRLPFLSAFERQQVENRVVEEAKSLLDRAKDGGCPAPPPPLPAEDKPSTGSEEPPAKRPASAIHSLLAEIFCPAAGAEDQEEVTAQLLEELSNFKSQKVLGLHEDPLKWWSDRLALFPVLPQVLQKYWCVAATRVPPERLFGSAANVVSAKRNRLAPAHVDQQVFLYENGRAAAASVEAEPEDEDEGEWGLDQEQLFPLGDPASGGFFGLRDGGFL